MIKFSEGELLQMLPSQMKNDIDMICLSYAIKECLAKLLKYNISTRSVQFVDRAPEKVLDVLAVELRCPYYDETLDIETKRALIKNTMKWHSRAGTPAVVNELIDTLFDYGASEEWFDYGGKPYHFKVKTTDLLNADTLNKFQVLLKKSKNVRSHLDGVEIQREIHPKAYCGIGMYARHRPAAIHADYDFS